MKIVYFLAIAGVLGLALVGGESPAEDSLTQYCSMVRDGLWPDYQGVYNKACHK